jgi:S-ribosylhomocysteine lyase LuxS involved in autoinducer biosynthesis
MNKIASFTVNHLDLLTGVYVSRKDYIGDVCLTTFDLRFTRPNEEPPMDTPGIHSIEHLVATFEGKAQAEYFRDTVKVAMDELRAPVDKAEMIVDKEFWPFPSYSELLFEV